MNTTHDADMQVLLTELSRLAKELSKIVTPFGKLKPENSKSYESAMKQIKRLPSSETLVSSVSQLRSLCEELEAAYEQQSLSNYNQAITSFIKEQQTAGQSTRETSEGWRVGPLELKRREERRQIRWSYNHYDITSWQLVYDADSVLNSFTKALNLLESTAIDPGECTDVFAMALAKGSAGKSHLPMPAFYRALRKVILERAIDSGKLGAKLDKYTDFPVWAFLYNVDKYNEQAAKLGLTPRLGFQTGSQQEVSRGGCFSINGLNASREYRTVCNVIRVGGGD